ncbi:DUF5320 domain-containing protein [Tissierella sp.]|uniref:DUF5320 domain-containing protein n=1 Tax=Tissierella sp. TaxID=41274 RepID=UPI0028A71957|nr:DUF5320 domain-containing protein [Tissierella sp.]
MFGRYGMGKNKGRRCNRRGVHYGLRRNSLYSTMCIREKDLLEEQKVLLERRLEMINTQLEFCKGE